jgi:hypothetical protein
VSLYSLLVYIENNGDESSKDYFPWFFATFIPVFMIFIHVYFNVNFFIIKLFVNMWSLVKIRHKKRYINFVEGPKLLQGLGEHSLNDRISNLMEVGSYCIKWIRLGQHGRLCQHSSSANEWN